MENLSNHSVKFYRTLCDQSFYWFVRIVGGSVRHGGCITPEIHKPLCDFWQDQTIKRKAIFMPRNWLKSTVFTEWGSIWRWLKDPTNRIILISQNQDKANAFLYYIKKQLLTNKILHKLYKDRLVYANDEGQPQILDKGWTGNKENRWASKWIDLPRPYYYKEPSITSIGVGGAAQSGHYTDISVDDPVGKKHIDSDTELEKVLTYHDNIDELLENANWMEQDGSFVTIVCTFWGPGDYGTYVKKNYKEYEWRVVPGLKDDDLESDSKGFVYIQNPNADHFTSNWENAPKGKGKTEYYHSMMANPEKENIFWSQIMNNPQKGTGLNKFEKDWIRYYVWREEDTNRIIVPLKDDGKEEEDSFPLSEIPLYGMIDPGGFAEDKLMKKGSRNAIVVGGQPNDSIKKFVVYTWAGRLKAPEAFLDEVFKANEKFNVLAWRIEPYGQQQYIFNDILEAGDKRGIPISISMLPYEPFRGIKGDDIQALMNPFFNGEIYLHRTMYEAIAEIGDYPSMTKDIIDMIGKLNKHYWCRKPMDDLLKTNRESRRYADAGRNPVDGY